MKTDIFWLATLDGEPCNCFETREKAVSWLKKIVNQVAKDFKKQDRLCAYDYDIKLRRLEIKAYEKRKAYLGL